MFQALFKKAEATVDNAVAGIMWRVVVAIPFLVALGFGAAALSSVLNQEFGPTQGNLMMAGIFCAAGLIAAVVASSRSTAPTTESVADTAAVSATSEENSADGRAGDAIDQEFMAAALSTIGPLAAPLLIRTALRHLPLILAVLAAGFVLTRDTASEAPSPLQPAE